MYTSISFCCFSLKTESLLGQDFVIKFHRLQIEKTEYTEKYHDMTLEYIPYCWWKKFQYKLYYRICTVPVVNSSTQMKSLMLRTRLFQMKNEISLTISKKMQRQVYPGIWKFYQVFFVAPNGNSLCYWCFNPAGISNGVVLEFMGHINYLLSQLLTHQNSSINHITEVLFRQKKSWWSNFPSQLFSNSPTNSSPQLKHHTHIYPVQKIASLQKPLKKLPPYCNTHTPHHTQPAELSCRIKGIMPSFLGFFAWNLNRRQPFREGRWIFFRAACFTYKKSLLLPVCFFFNGNIYNELKQTSDDFMFNTWIVWNFVTLPPMTVEVENG